MYGAGDGELAFRRQGGTRSDDAIAPGYCGLTRYDTRMPPLWSR